jgi:hypothetical protein
MSERGGKKTPRLTIGKTKRKERGRKERDTKRKAK